MTWPVILIPFAIVLYLFWYSVAGRHRDRSLANAALVYAGMLILTLLSATSLLFGAQFADMLLRSNAYSPEKIPERIGIAAPAVFLLSVVAGVYLTVHTIRTRSPLHTLVRSSETQKRLLRLCAWAIALVFVILPAVAYLTLLMNFNSYSYNRLGWTGSVAPAFEVIFWNFHVGFVAFLWWPFLALYFVLSRTIIERNLGKRAAMFVIGTALTCFSIPYGLMLYVLAFDVMELDFPGSTLASYQTYFLWLAPGIGAISASVWLVGIWVVSKLTSRFRNSAVPSGPAGGSSLPVGPTGEPPAK